MIIKYHHLSPSPFCPATEDGGKLNGFASSIPWCNEPKTIKDRPGRNLRKRAPNVSPRTHNTPIKKVKYSKRQNTLEDMFQPAMQHNQLRRRGA